MCEVLNKPREHGSEAAQLTLSACGFLRLFRSPHLKLYPTPAKSADLTRAACNIKATFTIQYSSALGQGLGQES